MKLTYIILLVLLISIVLAETESKKNKNKPIKSVTYSARRDLRKCAYPMCGGYFIKEVNSNEKELYVSKFIFGSDLVINKSLILEANPKELLLSGQFRETQSTYNELIISRVYRIVPIASSHKDVVYFSIQVEKHGYKLTEINTGKYHTIGNFKDNYTSISHLDQTWLTNKVESTAIISGVLIANNDSKKESHSHALSIDQIFIQLPDPLEPCPELPLAKCAAGSVMAYTRNSNRCLKFDGCVKSGVCTLSIPVCDKGYKLISFISRPHACPSYFCDPDYL